MRLYHLKTLTLLVILLLLTGCDAPQVTQGVINVRVSADGKTAELQIPVGSTAEDALQIAGVTLDALDRTEPPLYTVLTEDGLVRVIRVREEFTVEEVTLAFDKQLVRNESLPEGETRLVQPGVNGLQEITYRRVHEDGVEMSVSPVKTVILQKPVPEIVMVGSQSPFTPIPIPGRLAYISGGNAWVMEGTTGNRRPVVVTGDLDGQVFKLSPDGGWLLFTRRSEDENVINTLWAAKIGDDSELVIDLKTQNIIHFADWVPTSVLRVAYSTVEPRDTPPGWQANNDLVLVSFSTTGWLSPRMVALEANSGGIYGWWGMSFAWAPDGLRLGYTRPDGIGVIDLRDDEETLSTPILEITPYQTQSDWAWTPGLTWGPTENVLYTVDHAASDGVASPEESPLFNLTAVPLEGGAPIAILPQTGMFAAPVPSPLRELPSGELAYQLAYLQAIFPTQSDTSRYRLMVMDRDGSNRKELFPGEGAPGLDPQQVLWSPEPAGIGTTSDGGGYWIAVVYQGNLWLINPATGEASQLTGDGLIDRLDWK
ncbi:MAG: G5 domain-containing protein [Anaerolineales bacterium]